MTTARNRPPKEPNVPPADASELSIKKKAPARMNDGRLAFEPPPIVRARHVHLTFDDTVTSAFGKMMEKAAEQALGNVEAVLDARNPDGVHQLRVGLRRVRSVLSLFRRHLAPEAKTLDRDVHRALRVLGEARDLDVFLTETLPYALKDHPDDRGLLALCAAAQQQKINAYANVHRMLSSDHLSDLFNRLSRSQVVKDLVVREDDAALDNIASQLLQVRHKKVLKAGRHFAQLSTAKRHQVRIALKKLRYACDYFQGLYSPVASRAYLKQLKRLQDDLGRLNDAAVAGDLANRLARKQPEAQAGVGLLTQWFDDVLASRTPHMVEAWDDFENARPFWHGGETAIFR